ncbi:MAG TPA: ABC transporter ATP-binding protein [Tepidisphaeraceae bacterium]|nr:ABC transporter ATP-binding protein [Tepidisphaeraceae bacterium]
MTSRATPIHGRSTAGSAGAPDVSAGQPPRGRLVLQGITCSFNGAASNGHRNGGAADRVLDGIDLVCEPGQFVVVVGPSGSGKSTLLNIAAGMLKPDGGTVLLDGKPVNGPGPDRAMVFQDHGLFPWLTAAQNIEFGLKMAGLSPSQRRDRVAEALQRVHLLNSASKLVHELSGGMKQRVAIARALVMDPAVLLMDEPFASLDAQTRTLLHAQLQELWCQTHKTILFVTHSVGEAVRLADRIIVLSSHPGRVRREVKVQLAHPRDFDSPEITQLVQLVRREIEDEVNRVNAQQAADFWKPAKPTRIPGEASGYGDGI